MLAEMTTASFDEWLAYQMVEPFEDGWLQAGVVAATVQNSVLSALSAYVGKRLKDSELSAPGAFVPNAEPKEKRGDSLGAFRSIIEEQAHGNDR